MDVVLSPDDLKRGSGALKGCLPIKLRDKLVPQIIDWVSSEILRVYNARPRDEDDVPDRVAIDFSQEGISDSLLQEAAQKIAAQSQWTLTTYDSDLKTIFVTREVSVPKATAGAVHSAA